MNRKFIARQLILEAKRLLAAGKDDSDYVYDPDHKHKPKGGHWEKTEKGWSQKKKDKMQRGKNKLTNEERETRLLKTIERIKKKESALDLSATDYKINEKLSKNFDNLSDAIKNALLDAPPAQRYIAKYTKDSSVLRKIWDKRKIEDNVYAKFAKKEVLLNPVVPKEILDEAVIDKNGYVRLQAAKSPNITRDQIKELEKDPISNAYALSLNIHTSDEALSKIAEIEPHKKWCYRELTEDIPFAFDEVLEEDRWAGVDRATDANRYGYMLGKIATHPNASNETLHKIIERSNTIVGTDRYTGRPIPIWSLESEQSSGCYIGYAESLAREHPNFKE